MEGKISSKVLGLKFMQRAADKRKRADEAAKPKEEANEEHWIAPGGGAGSGCVVVMEGGGDLPASTSGRLSFKGFKTGPKTAYQGGAAAIEEHEDIATGEADVGDEAMAERLGKKEKKKEGKSKPAVGGGGGGGSERKGKDKEGKRRDVAGEEPRKKKKKVSK